MAVKVDTSRVDALKQTVEEVVSTYYLLTACTIVTKCLAMNISIFFNESLEMCRIC